jgi:hypothetical protein
MGVVASLATAAPQRVQNEAPSTSGCPQAGQFAGDVTAGSAPRSSGVPHWTQKRASPSFSLPQWMQNIATAPRPS